MDWNVAKKIAEKMGAAINDAVDAGRDHMTLVAAMLLFVSSFDESEKDTNAHLVLKRPDNLRQFYASAKDCLYSMKDAFPPEPGKPN